MIRKLKLYSKMILKILNKEVVNNIDYKADYNNVAATYQCWLARMGNHTDNIIQSSYIPNDYLKVNQQIKILDFACGTGYISRKIIEQNIPCKITAVDISDKMLEQCADLSSKGVKLVNMDGMDYLNTTKEKYDVIFCGWALPYFQHKLLLEKFKTLLNEDGIIGVIANCKGTLSKMDKVFLNVMKENVELVNKPMNISFSLPKDKNDLIKWFNYTGFKALETGEGEEVVSFDSPDKLLEWLNITGALAGTTYIFKDYESVKANIIDLIKKEKYKNNQYFINHKFVYGLFQKGRNNNESK